MITMDKLLNFRSAACLVTALLAAPGCDREAGPSGVRKRPAASAAASASVTPQGLRLTTAEQLLGSMKSSGKKATLVNAWASWCGPCRREVPMLQALAANFKPQGVEIVLVSVDDAKDEAKAASFLKDNGITLRSYLVAENLGDFKNAINPRWPGMLPASFLFDAQGRLVHFWGGEAFEQEIVPVIDAFLAGRAIDSETRFGLAPGKVEQ